MKSNTVTIPTAILADPDLTPAAKLVGAYICSTASASVSQTCRATCLHPTTVRTAIRQLRDAGLVTGEREKWSWSLSQTQPEPRAELGHAIAVLAELLKQNQ